MNDLLSIVVLLCSLSTSWGFSPFVPACPLRRPASWQPDCQQQRQRVHSLYGILEEMNGDLANTASSMSMETDESVLEDLYFALIFSADTVGEIRNQMEACIRPEFTDFLESSMASAEDEEERQGIQELIHLISTVKEETATEQAIADSKQAADADSSLHTEEEFSAPEEPMLSNADVLRKANQLDKAVASAATSDDEKPSDFISDCREVVNLSRGFNNRGQMRVGGR